ncbi:cyclin-dependent kinase 20-like [Metopolophium dirhodum]|uniref:cyclin-dependent kinase 20-like n=1 Tax=Metopolophium dirhodum TaxID=44670 RepID=UPI0029900D07|nr:cyclin-dependent kinase 20-like [Metopolophium dirhodum]
MESYKILERIGEGTHGQVVQAMERSTGQTVAIKCVRSSDKASKNLLREIESLKALDSDYVVKLLDHFCHSFSLYLVLEFVASGLPEMLYDDDIRLDDFHLKTYARMLLAGVVHMHATNIVHRDLKPANLLISSEGVLKIADFSLSRLLLTTDVADDDQSNRCYTGQVATRRYRAPELLFGSVHYDQSIDMWSVGCILAEMQMKTPLFSGDSDMEQIAIVVHNLGTPTDETWPNRNEMPDYNKLKFTHCNPVPTNVLLPDIDELLVDLVGKLILYNAGKRLNAQEALLHPYFFNEPLPCLEHLMPKPPKDHRQKLLPKPTEVIESLDKNFSCLYTILDETL